MKRTKVYALIALVLCFLLGVVATGIAEGPWTWLGTQKAKVDSLENKDEIVAYVNGEPVTYGALVHNQNVIEFNNMVVGISEPADAASAFIRIVKFKVQEAAAKQAGLWPSDEETHKHIRSLRDAFDTIGGDAKKELGQYLQGLGVTEDEYFEDYAFEGYRSALAMGLLKAKLASAYTELDPAEAQQRVDQEIEAMAKSAEVKVVNAALKASLK